MKIGLTMCAVVVYCLGIGCALAPKATTSATALQNAPTFLATPTFDGSGAAMHPGVVDLGQPWHGYRYWMSMTPYPNNDGWKESPSILVSNDRVNWTVPTGGANPIVGSGSSLYADPDVFYNAAGDELWLIYLFKGGGRSTVQRVRSRDGVSWTPPENLFSDVYPSIISPAIVQRDNTYYTWSINASSAGCSSQVNTVELRTSADALTWSAARQVAMAIPGWLPWHLDVVDTGTEFWALVAAYPDGKACSATQLFFARSLDAVNWTTSPGPVLAPSKTGWDSSYIYRSTFVVDAAFDKLYVWYSASGPSDWHTGFTEADASTFPTRAGLTQ